MKNVLWLICLFVSFTSIALPKDNQPENASEEKKKRWSKPGGENSTGAQVRNIHASS